MAHVTTNAKRQATTIYQTFHKTLGLASDALGLQFSTILQDSVLHSMLAVENKLIAFVANSIEHPTTGYGKNQKR